MCKNLYLQISFLLGCYIWHQFSGTNWVTYNSIQFCSNYLESVPPALGLDASCKSWMFPSHLHFCPTSYKLEASPNPLRLHHLLKDSVLRKAIYLCLPFYYKDTNKQPDEEGRRVRSACRNICLCRVIIYHCVRSLGNQKTPLNLYLRVFTGVRYLRMAN